jgi:hypothetical protein
MYVYVLKSRHDHFSAKIDSPGSLSQPLIGIVTTAYPDYSAISNSYSFSPALFPVYGIYLSIEHEQLGVLHRAD